jgi:formylglycine-generating enzyme required for sulfatase activity
MIRIPGGHFSMGSDERDALDFEKPSHKVHLSPYCIDKYEVTVTKYKTCADAGDCKGSVQGNQWDGISDSDRKAFDPLCTIRDPLRLGEHPINCVDWDQASAYCKSRARLARLPTEAEWEFAARGAEGRIYPWGDEPPSGKWLNACGKECVAWGKKNNVDETSMYQDDDGFANTAPVGSFPKGASRFGLQDVAGNVWEWVSDWNAPYGSDDQSDPKGPPSGTARVLRGGAWNGGYASWVRPTFRYREVPGKRTAWIGFRCAMDLR